MIMNENKQGIDNRNFSRIPFDANVQVEGNGGSWESKLLDLSLKGALIKRPQEWDSTTGDNYTLHINLGTDITINMDVSVSHIEDDHIGFRCNHIDLDSITHLRRIVELNMGDEELLNRELSALTSG
jgi:hypothetical protein